MNPAFGGITFSDEVVGLFKSPDEARYHVIEMNIKPFTSVGPLTLGSSIHKIKNQIGVPSSVNDEDFGDGKITKTFKYDPLGIELCFYEEDEFVLGSITIHSSNATLFGKKVIGLTEERLLTDIKDTAGNKPILEDDFEDSGKDYAIDSLGLSFWVVAGKVVNVTVFPEYDATGNNPIWPKIQ